jgi:hypothetical protein
MPARSGGSGPPYSVSVGVETVMPHLGWGYNFSFLDNRSQQCITRCPCLVAFARHMQMLVC